MEMQKSNSQDQSDAIDKDSRTDLKKRKITINDDGSAIVVETIATTTNMSPSDFSSWMRQHEKTRDEIKDTLSDDVRKATEGELKKVEDDIEGLKEYIKESEEKAKVHYEKLKKDGLISKVSEELEKPMSEINIDYMNSVWKNLIENEKDVLDALSAEQKQKFLKIKLRLMKNNRGKKQ